MFIHFLQWRGRTYGSLYPIDPFNDGGWQLWCEVAYGPLRPASGRVRDPPAQHDDMRWVMTWCRLLDVSYHVESYNFRNMSLPIWQPYICASIRSFITEIIICESQVIKRLPPGFDRVRVGRTSLVRSHGATPLVVNTRNVIVYCSMARVYCQQLTNSADLAYIVVGRSTVAGDEAV